MSRRLHRVVVWKKEGACHIPLEPQINIVTLFYADMLILFIGNMVSMETWDRWPNHDTKISTILALQGLKLSRPKYRIENYFTHGNVLIFLHYLCQSVVAQLKDSNVCAFYVHPKWKKQFWYIIWLGGPFWQNNPTEIQYLEFSPM